MALGIVCSGFLTSSDIDANMPVGLRQYAPWIKPMMNAWMLVCCTFNLIYPGVRVSNRFTYPSSRPSRSQIDELPVKVQRTSGPPIGRSVRKYVCGAASARRSSDGQGDSCGKYTGPSASRRSHRPRCPPGNDPNDDESLTSVASLTDKSDVSHRHAVGISARG